MANGKTPHLNPLRLVPLSAPSDSIPPKGRGDGNGAGDVANGKAATPNTTREQASRRTPNRSAAMRILVSITPKIRQALKVVVGIIFYASG